VAHLGGLAANSWRSGFERPKLRVPRRDISSAASWIGAALWALGICGQVVTIFLIRRRLLPPDLPQEIGRYRAGTRGHHRRSEQSHLFLCDSRLVAAAPPAHDGAEQVAFDDGAAE